MSLSPFGWIFLAMTTVYLPLVAMRSAYRVRRPGGRPTRRQHLLSVAIVQGWFLLMALMAARTDRVYPFPPPRIEASRVAMVLAFLVPALGTLPARWWWKPVEERDRLRWMYPRRPIDLTWWAAVSLVAGTVEEVVYRGVMFTLWRRVLGSWWAAASVCVVAFALAHFVQGWRAMVAIVLFTGAFHAMVWQTGDLYTAMTAHVLYDLGAGVLILGLYRRSELQATT